ncbi:sterile alpha motif domain-containing protein 9-like [Salvelinus fontinalis]|uniref:sterile alpha motif domain-containing protein 9-like n=1 Tax=Salvelinus fontinalis TaxID=8038 RepID=UPI0024863419|nr:sterile alpha motif domain-containing protein 9-like [Salvelinus fontinalis]XP_055797051.1 sterile alpha motif domain-containing protein 9-like [Salvelinus fontinalis]XP_055797052.1 sterile alpha motif domain-containing protein 9-like [Salvelinus fontinalis]XP_055797054.1 sterile alpha motif domain-containing protein 9-like [Salvelinus fontinalis]
MSHSMESATQIKKWTNEEVHQWLTTQVNINHIYADKLLEEEVSGEVLQYFQKKDLLDLNIKHGPAVKIVSMLEELKSGLQHKSRFPAYIKKWTQEQVCQWLREKAKVYHQYVERIVEEEVSGDCLFCFKKNDLVELGIKHGPAVKIIGMLEKLNSGPEPILQPPTHINVDQENLQKTPEKQVELCQAPPVQTVSPMKTEPNTEELKIVEPSGKTVTRKKEVPKPQAMGAEMLPSKFSRTSNSLALLYDTLDDLHLDEFKRFKSCLKDVNLNSKPIARCHLENSKTCTDVANAMTKHYGEEALNVTLQILERIGHNELAAGLRRNLGLQKMTEQDPQKYLRRETDQGDKLKSLLTCGDNTLDRYDQCVIVMNKSCTEQLEYLQFLTKLKLFCVLDFDPNSGTDGACSFYTKSRAANLHFPAQFQDEVNGVIKNLNLYKQTSWVFCNGRHAIQSEWDKELNYEDWLNKTCGDVEHIVSFMCKPEVLSNRRTLVIFLLLSPVKTERDPVYDIFMAFYKKEGWREIIMTICESQSTFEKWKDLIQNKSGFDITKQSIYELTLSEVNGTIMALGPHNQPSGKLLPSSDSSTVVLQQKDEDRMTALDILCQNQCEKAYDGNDKGFQDFKIKVEEEFYRGGKVKWWNFYFCEKPKAKPFIRRDKYDNLKTIVKSQDPKTTCVLVNLFHHPGCGGTTLAMHVMWNLRREFRCAVLKDYTLPKAEVAFQVKNLMRLGSDKSTPVLLLVDDSKEAENTQTLQNCIRQAVEEENASRSVEDSLNSKVIIISCVRCPNPEDQYKNCATKRLYITAKLKKKEQDDFDEKLVELKKSHEKPENFYSFMIMKSNFDKKYIADVVSNTLKDLDMSTKQAKLLAFLALLNSYDAESHISTSLCEEYLGLDGSKIVFWGNESLFDRMEPYSNLLKQVNVVEKRGKYKAIRILHNDMANACLEELDRSYKINLSEITLDILHCDLFFKTGVVKDALMLSIQRMLIERQRRKLGDERDTQFSPLIEKIHLQEDRENSISKIQDIFVKASSRFVTKLSIPQAFARYLYLYEQDYPQALIWAEKAKIVQQNSYTADTIGQVYKSNLKHNIQIEKQKTLSKPEDFETNLKIAQQAIQAFQLAQKLAMKNETEEETDEYLIKTPYNTSGYVGEMEITLTVFEMISNLPFFEGTDPVKRMYMQSFLKGTLPITNVPKEDNEINSKYVDIIKEHTQFLLALKPQVKKVFEFFNGYFTYIKGNNTGELESLNQKKISDHFTRYITLVCSSPAEIFKERADKPKLRLNVDIEERRMFLEENNADTFAGILAKLHQQQNIMTAEEVKKITESYTFLHIHSVQKRKDTKICQNLILANIILHTLKPISNNEKCHKDLCDILMKTLQDIGVQHPSPEPYYLALLLLWPSSNEENTDIRTYVNSLRNSSRRELPYLSRKCSTIVHFYLGPKKGLQRLVTKPKLDECFSGVPRADLAQLWWSEGIFKEREIIDRLYRVNGTVEQSELYANYGKLKIPVRPAYLGGIRSGYSKENVSFFLGFAIDGPLAYDIKYE